MTEVISASHVDSPGAVSRTRLPTGVGVWFIGGYAEARTALADDRLLKGSAALTRIMSAQLAAAGHSDEMTAMFAPHMLASDGTDHARKRRLVVEAFTPRRVTGMRPAVERIAEELLGRLDSAADPVDLVAELAFPLPLAVICDLMGVPVPDRAPFRGWSMALTDENPAEAMAASQEMVGYLAGLLQAKRSDPGDDLISALAVPENDDDRLDDQELIGTLVLLLVAGHETTTNLIGNGVRWLLDDPARWRSLAEDSTLVPAAVQELLRYEGPVANATYRYTAEEVTVDGTTIPADEIVLVSLSSANRDNRAFPDADRLDLQRPDARRNLSFGHGVHYCLGATLGRMEAEIVLTRLTARFPDARLAVDPGKLRRVQSPIMQGYRELPVRLR